jgi:hypothetical protein
MFIVFDNSLFFERREHRPRFYSRNSSEELSAIADISASMFGVTGVAYIKGVSQS